MPYLHKNKERQIRKKGSNEPSINLTVCLVRAINRKSTYTEENDQLDHAQKWNLRKKHFIVESAEGKQRMRGHKFTPPPLRLYRRGKATVPTVKSRSRPPKRRNRSPTRTPPKLIVAADGSGDVFPRELPEGYMQSSFSTRVRTVGFGPRPRGATVGDWTFGSSPHPRKCSLTRLQGPNERKTSIPECDKWLLRSTSIKTKTFGE